MIAAFGGGLALLSVAFSRSIHWLVRVPFLLGGSSGILYALWVALP